MKNITKVIERFREKFASLMRFDKEKSTMRNRVDTPSVGYQDKFGRICCWDFEEIEPFLTEELTSLQQVIRGETLREIKTKVGDMITEPEGEWSRGFNEGIWNIEELLNAELKKQINE